MTVNKGKRTVRLAVILLVFAVIAYGGYRYMQLKAASEHADAVLETLRSVIPDFGVDTGTSSGQGRDPLPALIVDNKDIVGCIEVPSVDLMAPVTAKGQEEEGFATLVSGSPVKGRLRLTGNRQDVFRKISKAKPGDTVVFTDIDGVRYHYKVLTQYHLKDWDKAKDDLMLCYKSDDQTDFVLGCTAAD
jgi:sortase (surface protein transpeptidase)